jgi:predicted glycosyltransferase
MRPSILIHCQYVYGIGHFVRAAELARSLRADFDVHLVSGGEPVPNFTLPEGIAFTQLPPVFKDEASGQLRSVDPAVDLDTCLARRADMLASLVQDRRPDIVITEHFPFGLLFEAEVVGMLGRLRRLRPDALVVSSVRDVIESAQGGKDDARTCELIEQWFDLILVHGDARALPLRASFPLIDRIRTPYVHTGYVVEPAQPRRLRAGLPLLVGAIGGGRVGQELLAALMAAHHAACADWPHELLLFRGAFEHDATTPGAVPGRVRVRPFDRQAYRQALSEAAGLICLGGYNSVLEALSMSLPALVYKRRFLGTNREQALRADFFPKSKLVMTIEEADLAAPVLAQHMVSHFATPPARPPELDFQGAANTARILLARWRATRQQ